MSKISTVKFKYYAPIIAGKELTLQELTQKEAITKWTLYIRAEEGIELKEIINLFTVADNEPDHLPVESILHLIGTDEVREFKAGDPIIFQGKLRELKLLMDIEHLRIFVSKGINVFIYVESDKNGENGKVFNFEILK